MALEQVLKVREAENEAAKIREQSLLDAKKLVADAGRLAAEEAGKAAADVKAESDALIKQAEKEGLEAYEKILGEARVGCEEIKKNAEGRIDGAARIIVERLVK